MPKTIIMPLLIIAFILGKWKRSVSINKAIHLTPFNIV